MRFSRPSRLSQAIRVSLGFAFAIQALPVFSLDSLSSHDSIISLEPQAEAFQQNYGHLYGPALAEMILTQSGLLAIDSAMNTLYPTQNSVHLLGLSLEELAAVAWGVATASDEQIYTTQIALDALQLDSLHPYGSLAHAKATILRRAAQTMGQQALLQQDSLSHNVNGQLDTATLNALAADLSSYMTKAAGEQQSKTVSSIDLTERSVLGLKSAVTGGNTQPEIIITGSDSVLRGQNFDPLADVLVLDAEDGDLTNKLSVQGNVDTDKVGSYELKYSVTDSQGQTTTAQRTVTVTQNESNKPHINGAGPKLIYTGQSFDPMAGVTAWDEEDGDLTSRIEVSGSVDTTKADIFLVNYSVMDSDGHSDRRNRMVLVEDLRAKSITYKGLKPVYLNLYQPFNPMAGVQAEDATDGDITSNIKVSNPVDTSKGGIYRVRYQVTNSQGATKSRFRTVIVQNSLPSIELSGDMYTTITVGEHFDPLTGLTAIDKEDGDLTSRIQLISEFNNQIPGVYKLHYQVEDNNGGVGKFVRRVTVENVDVPGNTLPTITVQQPFVRVPVDGSFDPWAGVTALDNEDGDLTSAITLSGEVDVHTPGYYQLIYSVVDSAGAVTAIERRVAVDNHIPTFQGANGLLLPLNAHFNPMDGVTANDVEDGDLTAAVEVAGAVDTSKGGLYTVLYSVTDRHGGQGYALRAVVVENQVPEFAGLDSVTIGHDQPFDPLAGVTATDTEDGDLTAQIQVSDNLDISKPGAYVLTYTVKDSGGAVATGMRGVVVKNTVPEINGIAPITITAGDAFDPFAGITAWDAEDGDLTAALQVSGNLDTTKAGIYTLHYLVKDSQGASARRGRSVMVKARFNQAPELSGVSATTITVGTAFDAMTGITATDAEDGDLSSAITISGSVDTEKAGRYRLTYRVKDSGGKSDTAYRMVTVTNSAPELSGIDRIAIPRDSDFDPMAGVTAFDEEDGDITSRITVSGSVNTGRPGSYRLKYSVTDDHGKKTQKTRTVKVER